MSDRFLAPPLERRNGGYVPPPPPVIETHRILAETGEVLNTERSDKMRTEQNNS